MKQKLKLFFHIAVLLAFLVLIACSFGYPRQRVVFPMIVFVLAVVVTILKIIVLIKPELQCYLDPQGILQGVGRKQPGTSNPPQSPEPSPIEGKIFMSVVMAWIFATMVVVYLFGFIIGLAVSSFVYVKALGRESWTKSILMAVLLPASMYIIFNVGLQVNLYQGLFL